MSKALMLIADGLEECEGLIVVDLLRRGGVEVTTASIKEGTTILSSHGITFETDCSALALENWMGFDAVILPGGHGGTMNLKASPLVAEILKAYAADESKLVTAICAAPSILGDLGLLEGKRATCFPGFESHLKGAEYTAEPVTEDGRFVTGNGLGAAIPFGLHILSRLEGPEIAEEIRQKIQYPFAI